MVRAKGGRKGSEVPRPQLYINAVVLSVVCNTPRRVAQSGVISWLILAFKMTLDAVDDVLVLNAGDNFYAPLQTPSSSDLLISALCCIELL